MIDVKESGFQSVSLIPDTSYTSLAVSNAKIKDTVPFLKEFTTWKHSLQYVAWITCTF